MTPAVPQPEVPGRPQHLGHRLATQRRVAHDPLPDAAATDLELRLHEQHEVGIRVRDVAQRLQHVAQRDEAEVADDERDAVWRGDVPNEGLCATATSVSPVISRMLTPSTFATRGFSFTSARELPVADVDGETRTRRRAPAAPG